MAIKVVFKAKVYSEKNIYVEICAVCSVLLNRRGEKTILNKILSGQVLM